MMGSDLREWRAGEHKEAPVSAKSWTFMVNHGHCVRVTVEGGQAVYHESLFKNGGWTEYAPVSQPSTVTSYMPFATWQALRKAGVNVGGQAEKLPVSPARGEIASFSPTTAGMGVK